MFPILIGISSSSLSGVPPWSNGSALGHRSLPPVFESLGVGTSEGCVIFDFSLTCAQKWP